MSRFKDVAQMTKQLTTCPCMALFRREIARMVVQRAAALDHSGASPSLQACAQDVGDNCAVLGDEVRELLRKLALEKVA